MDDFGLKIGESSTFPTDIYLKVRGKKLRAVRTTDLEKLTIEEIDPLTEWSLNECDNAFKTTTENEVFSEAVTEDENDSDPLLSDSSFENEIDPLLSTSDLDNGVMMVDNVGDIVS